MIAVLAFRLSIGHKEHRTEQFVPFDHTDPSDRIDIAKGCCSGGSAHPMNGMYLFVPTMRVASAAAQHKLTSSQCCY